MCKIKFTVTEGDDGGIGGGDEKKEERHDGDGDGDGDTSHCNGSQEIKRELFCN